MYLTKAFINKDEVIPWNSLRYLIGEAMYGGRVTDSFDRRILVTYLEEYMGDFLFDDYQKFYFARDGFDYVVPETGPIEDYRESVTKLPLDCSPTVFGLHPNADIRFNFEAVRDIWRNLIDLQPRTAGGGGGMSRDEYIGQVAADVLKQIPETFDLVIVRKEFEKLEKAKEKAKREAEGADGEATQRATGAVLLPPTTIVLLQEIERWNALVVKMGESLVELQKALLGIVGMSNELDDLAEALFNGTLPSSWRRLAPQTQKGLGSWMTHYNRRYKQYSSWVEDVADPKVMWLSGLHIPESYLTALVQATCRKKGWPLDKSIMYSKVTKMTSVDQVEKAPEDGCYIIGLYLEGASWDLKKGCLRRQDPKVLITDLPLLEVIPIESNKLKLQDTFKTPVYATQDRRSAMGVGLVFEADLATPVHPSHWTLQGAALCLNVDT
jgi:dynein heavy chain